ncbi:alpha/beta fold hydrolase [Nonomuraea helvata]|uniref:Alpha/beta fold hydrolase n=1 Tax=Nonomuraea helvata TaxID=37484 RepID=A0ABV5SJ33_9ACTN
MTQTRPVSVTHRTIDVDGVEIFYREAGPPDAPVLLLPHGYPCSSYEFRNLLPALGDRRRLVAPDLPGFGYSGTPGRDRFSGDDARMVPQGAGVPARAPAAHADRLGPARRLHAGGVRQGLPPRPA